jgi:16S rRNA processing protein RimM
LLGDRKLEVGRVVKAHGLRGEVVVSLVSDYPDVRLAAGSRLWSGDREVVVRTARPHQGRWLVQFEDVLDRTAAEALAGRVLHGEAMEDPEAIWVHELIGSVVVEEGTGVERGRVVSVLANPAHELLELESGALVPIVFVRSCEDGVTVVAVPEGLFEAPDSGA